MKAYLKDATSLVGIAKDVFQPKSLEEIQKIVLENKFITTRGAGTGLAGGCVPLEGKDVVVDLSGMDKILNFDIARKTVEVEAGVVLGDLEEFLNQTPLIFPVSPSSRETCTIGGMIATNAGDQRSGVYGKTSSWIKWIDIINDNAEVSRKGITEITDYAGLEGITGIIVKACLKLTEKRIRSASIIKIEYLDEAVSIARNLKRDLSVSIIDFLDKRISKGIGLGDSYHLVVEYENDSGHIKGEEYTKLLNILDEVYQFTQKEGFTRIEDPKIMIDRFIPLMEWCIKKDLLVYGSLSSGIINIFFRKEQEDQIPEMIKKVTHHGGSISGRFGIGFLKKEFLDPNDKKIIENVKRRCDPLNKFNNGKIL